MSNVPNTVDEEIDFINLIQILWNDKWKIVTTTSISILLVFCFNFIIPNTTFIAKTEIKPITSVEFEKYRMFNSHSKVFEKDDKDNKDVKDDKDDKDDKERNIFNIFDITQKSLLNIYIEQIEEGSLLETAIDKFNLINKDDFDSESDYKDAIEKFASKIEVLRPIEEADGIFSHHILKAKYNDKYKWKQLLSFVNEEANRQVKVTIVNHFASMVSIQNQKKDFAIKDIEIKIDNALEDYERNTKDRLAFLAEQAAIARKLNIQKNQIVENIKRDDPFYLRGYIAIEEEIKLIANRKNKNAFTSDLFKLEQQKRDLEQDETITRAVELFNETPVRQNNFKATIVKVATTDLEYNNRNLYYALAIVLGGMIGVFYVLLANAFVNRKNDIVGS